MSDTFNLTDALAKVQAELPKIRRDKTATVKSDKGNYSYSYADLGDIQPSVLPLLAREGLAWVTMPTLNADGKFVLRYTLRHTGGDELVGEYPLPAAGSPQVIGSAITYARRYCFTCVIGIVTDDDDDGQRAESAYRQAPTQRREGPPFPSADPEYLRDQRDEARQRAARMSLNVQPRRGKETQEERLDWLRPQLLERGYADTVDGWLALAADYERQANEPAPDRSSYV